MKCVFVTRNYASYCRGMRGVLNVCNSCTLAVGANESSPDLVCCLFTRGATISNAYSIDGFTIQRISFLQSS